jgi:hypothetical protein
MFFGDGSSIVVPSFLQIMCESLQRQLVGAAIVYASGILPEKIKGFNFRDWQLKPFLFQNIKLCYGFGPPVRPA